MNKRTAFLLFIAIFVLMMTACSSDNSNEKMDSDSTSNEMSTEMMMDQDESMAEDADDSSAEMESDDAELEIEDGEFEENRMVIHKAYLNVNVKNIEKTRQNTEKKAKKLGGYIVESNIYKEDAEYVSGQMTIRVPEKHFETFVNDTEEKAAEVIERNVTGEDVTEQYVDLDSRLTSKRAVEERLLEFMKDAKKTEDLLKISSDLATIQEDIELLVGKINYLENQTAYSTINISMFEKSVTVPGVGNKELDTWEKTKKQLATSLNFILIAGSGLIVFLIGNLPIILILLLVGTIIYLMVKRKMNEKK